MRPNKSDPLRFIHELVQNKLQKQNETNRGNFRHGYGILLRFTNPEAEITLLLGKSLGAQRRKIHRVLLRFTNPEPEITLGKKLGTQSRKNPQGTFAIYESRARDYTSSW